MSGQQTIPAEAFPASILVSLPLGVLVEDLDRSAVVWTNDAFLELVGLEAAQVVERTAPYPWGDDTAWPEPATGVPSRSVVRRPDGERVPVELTRFPVQDPLGRRLQATLVSDLTERLRLERQLVRSGRAAATGRLAAGIAHEINNPLLVVLGMVEFLLADAEPGTKPHERLTLIQQTGLEIRQIVRSLVEFAREPAEPEADLSLSELVRQTTSLARHAVLGRDVELVERYPDEQLAVSGSAAELKQAILNLLTNAQQAMPQGGTVTLELERRDDWAIVSVADGGSGIPEEALTRIFEPFFTTRRNEGAAGLGLSVALSVAEAHGGVVNANNTPDGGARFELRIPLAQRRR